MDNQIKECPFCGREAKIKAVIKSYVLPFGAHAIVEHEQRDFARTRTKRMTRWRISRSVRKEP